MQDVRMSNLMYSVLIIIIVGVVVSTTPPMGPVKCHRCLISEYIITDTLGEEVFSTLKAFIFLRSFFVKLQ